jgi:tRNA 2-thiouridine synthesizing protein B
MALILVKFNNTHPIEKIKIQNAKKDDTVVLIQDGIYWGLEDAKKLTDSKIVAIKEDVLARGYDEKDFDVDLIDYHEFIDIVEKEKKFIG